MDRPIRRARTRRARLRRAALAAAAGLVLGGAPAVAATAAPACAVTWGSLAETGPGITSAPIVGARAGRHDCFDRFVVDVAGPISGYDVRYVDAVHFGGAGHRVELRGGAVLRVHLRAPAPGPIGTNETELVRVPGFRTIRQVAMVDPTTSETTMALGVRARLPFRVLVLPGPSSRFVVDVAHRW